MKLRSFILLFVFLLVAACSSAEIESTTEPLSTEEEAILLSTQLPPVPNYQYHPLGVRTMIEEIDLVINAVDKGNPQELFVYLQTTCATVNALGGPPPCREGEAEGTRVEVMPFLESEGSFLRKEDIPNWTGLDVVGVYAVYEVSETVFSDPNYPAGDYAIALVSPKGKPGVVLHLTGDGIVRIDYVFDTCGSTLIDVLQRNAAYIVLAPVTP